MKTITLGSAKNQILTELGNPIQETSRSGMEILWYESKIPSKALFYYLNEGRLVALSTPVKGDTKTVNDYVLIYELPTYSIHRYKQDIFEDTPTQIIHVWPDKGISIIAHGQEFSSPVEREEHFTATTKEEFFKGWGKELATNTQVTLKSTSSGSIMHRSIPKQSESSWEFFIPSMITVVVLVLVGVIIHRFFRPREVV